ncbi:hypothetical protein [Sphingomonas sp. Mn802worker]|uniref:hypothetical protein n=1 Tax=Sphingomonas sp. Mn802worker TaxID=629773 RepID=UPI000365DD94|nr:hypothetical protein [Sphingomonas sp. Mn802worker]
MRHEVSTRSPKWAASPGRGCRTVDPALIARLEATVDRRTDTALTAQFGISYNTWRKMIAGQPVRASVLDRLEARLEQDDASANR